MAEEIIGFPEERVPSGRRGHPAGRTRTTGGGEMGKRTTNAAGSTNELRGDVLRVLGVLKWRPPTRFNASLRRT